MKNWIVQPVSITKDGNIVSYISMENCRLEVFDSFEKAKDYVSNNMKRALMEPEFCYTAADILGAYSKGRKPSVVYVIDKSDPDSYHYAISEKEVQ